MRPIAFIIFSLFLIVKTISKLNMVRNVKFKKKIKQQAVVVHVLHTTQSLIISRCCFAEDVNRFQGFITHVHSHCSAHETFCFVMFPLPLPSWFS